MTIGKYNAIEKITFNDGAETYFLVDTNSKFENFDCDLLSEFWFNEFREDNFTRKIYKNVSSLQEVLDFMDKEGVSYEEFYIDETLRVGGEHDMVIYKDLSYEWDEE